MPRGARRRRDPNANRDERANAYVRRDAYSDGAARDCDPAAAVSHADASAVPDGHADSAPHSNAVADSAAYPDAHRDSAPYAYAVADAPPHGDAYSRANAHSAGAAPLARRFAGVERLRA